MSEALTKENKKLVSELLETGRWGNKSEIIRYGLHLVKKEVETEQANSLRPYTADELRAAARQMTAAERAEDRAAGRASSRHYPKGDE